MRQIVRSTPAGIVLTAAAMTAVGGRIGGDSRWVAALGHVLVERGDIPDGVPYASAPSGHWHNVPALAELIFTGAYSLAAERGLLLLQILAVIAAFALLARDARRAEATEVSTSLALLIVLVGALPAVMIMRLQLFSLALFPALLLLLRSDRDHRTGRIWLLVPLFAIWANLHGCVLVGLGVALAYLVLDRARRTPIRAALVAGASLASTMLTPALLATPEYFRSLLENENARQGVGMWAAPSPQTPADVLMVLAALALVALALRTRTPLWELAAGVALAVSTASAARSGVWLLFLLATPAACGTTLRRAGGGAQAAVALVALAALAAGLAFAPSLHREQLVDVAVRAASGRPILADGMLGEDVVLSGGRVWVTNPLDAYSRRDQRLWLAWSEGRAAGDAARERARVILAFAGGPADRRTAADTRFHVLERNHDAVVWIRR